MLQDPLKHNKALRRKMEANPFHTEEADCYELEIAAEEKTDLGIPYFLEQIETFLQVFLVLIIQIRESVNVIKEIICEFLERKSQADPICLYFINFPPLKVLTVVLIVDPMLLRIPDDIRYSRAQDSYINSLANRAK